MNHVDYLPYQSPFPKCSQRDVSDPCSIDVFCAANVLACKGLYRTSPTFDLHAWTAGFSSAVLTSHNESFLISNHSIGVFAQGVTVACGPLEYDFSLGVGDSCSSAQVMETWRLSSSDIPRVFQLGSLLANNASVFMNVTARNLDGGTVFLTCAAARVDVSAPEAGGVRCSTTVSGEHLQSFASLSQIPVAIQGEDDPESLVDTVSLDVISAAGSSLLLSPFVIHSRMNAAKTFILHFASAAPQGSVVRIVKTVRNQASLESTVISEPVILDDTPPMFHGGPSSAHISRARE